MRIEYRGESSMTYIWRFLISIMLRKSSKTHAMVRTRAHNHGFSNSQTIHHSPCHAHRDDSHKTLAISLHDGRRHNLFALDLVNALYAALRRMRELYSARLAPSIVTPRYWSRRTGRRTVFGGQTLAIGALIPKSFGDRKWKEAKLSWNDAKISLLCIAKLSLHRYNM